MTSAVTAFLTVLACLGSRPALPAEGTPVYVTASFVDKNGLFIETLEKSEVDILENGNPKTIEFMARDEIPVAYGMLFERAMLPDLSDPGRVDPRYISPASIARNIAYGLIDKVLARQAIMVGDYDRELHVALDFATDGFTVKDAIQRLHSDRNSEESFLYAALFSAVERFKDRPEKRRVLIVFLETIDTDTSTKMKPLKNLLSASNIELFVINFGTKLPSSRRGSAQPAISTAISKELTMVTSGEPFINYDYRAHPDDIVRRLSNQLRTLYTFGIVSEADPGVPAKLEIRCSRPGSKVSHHQVVPVLH